ncbi:MAG TPA: dihydroorotate dehydrogenase electron transfer subunit [Dehalococcoidia bacterium]|nr:dihydroorotate dehydrogenase electron transfer subunit [Dehalococcoidia bacterium]
MKQITTPIISRSEVLPGTYHVRLEAPEIVNGAKPGQFVMVRCGEDTVVPRPFSIHRVEGSVLTLLFNVVGRGTNWLSQRKKGEILNFFGPLGNGFYKKPNARNVLIVAGGIGIAPLCFLANELLKAGLKVTLINGASTADCLLPVSTSQKLYDEGLKPGSLNVVNATEDGSEGYKGMATDLIPAYLEGIDQVFACGPMEMYRTMAKMPELKGMSVQVSMEIMMGCGVGVCYSCTIKTRKGIKQVCRDGPVFEMEELYFQ